MPQRTKLINAVMTVLELFEDYLDDDLENIPDAICFEALRHELNAREIYRELR